MWTSKFGQLGSGRSVVVGLRSLEGVALGLLCSMFSACVDVANVVCGWVLGGLSLFEIGPVCFGTRRRICDAWSW